jgi:hypothetical protein
MFFSTMRRWDNGDVTRAETSGGEGDEDGDDGDGDEDGDGRRLVWWLRWRWRWRCRLRLDGMVGGCIMLPGTVWTRRLEGVATGHAT